VCESPTRCLFSHRLRNGSPAVSISDMLAPSGVVPANDAGQDDDDVPAPRDLLVMAASDPVDQEQLHLYKILVSLNSATSK